MKETTKRNKKMETTKIKSWGVFYMPTKNGFIFAGLKPELVQKFDDNIIAHEHCANLNITGYIDEMHSGYSVKPIY